MKVKIVAIYLNGKALLWHRSSVKNGESWPEWERYKRAVIARFGVGAFDDPLADLMKLRQRGTVEQYQENFDALLNRVDLPVNHAVGCFLSGLNDEIQTAVRMFKPQTLHDAYCLAKLQEATLTSIGRRTKPILDTPPSFVKNVGSHTRTSQSYSSVPARSNAFAYSSTKNSPYQNFTSFTSKPRSRGRPLSPREIEEKRAKNLCFFCDEKYHLEHKCTAQVYRLEIMEETDGEESNEEEQLEQVGEGVQEDLEEEVPQISLWALAGINTYQTMRLLGRVRKHTLQILVDSGSTHNFLDLTTARRLKCDLKKIPQMQVVVADGSKLTFNAMCKGFVWNLHGEVYKAGMIVVPLGSCEMILGVL